MITEKDIRRQVVFSLQDDEKYDVQGIVRAIINTYGLIDIESLDYDVYWTLVKKHPKVPTIAEIIDGLVISDTEGDNEHWVLEYGRFNSGDQLPISAVLANELLKLKHPATALEAGAEIAARRERHRQGVADGTVPSIPIAVQRPVKRTRS